MPDDATTQPDESPGQNLQLQAASTSSPWKSRVLRMLVGTAAGGALGFGLYALVGCTSGCVILSSPYGALIYGAAVGAVAAFR